MSEGRVLVVDDKPTMREMISELLSDTYEVVSAADGLQGLAMVQHGVFDVVISDIKMPGMDGHRLMTAIKRIHPELEVILITAFATIPSAVDAMKDGAYHYLKKPFEADELRTLVAQAVERKRLADRAQQLRSTPDDPASCDQIIGETAAMRRVFGLIERAATRDMTVLISGESGTGKELVARAIHRGSARSAQNFVAINCGALPEALVESELFGYTRGAFTGATGDKPGLFEVANGGTLLLDEIGDLPLALQVKLTRVLQESAVRRLGDSKERQIDVRVVAATHVDLDAAVNEGRFREDLFYRLNIFPIELPALRARADDIPLLAAHFLRSRSASEPTDPPLSLSAEAMQALLRYHWPGNVRQLQNAIERALALTDGAQIDVEALPSEVVSATGSLPPDASLALTHREYLEAAKQRASREYLTELMRRFAGNVTQAAAHAGIERESLHRLLKKHAVSSRTFKDAD
ncbi:MAG: sigma-54-dependent Fis family transcriptional regulator [Deltaproteobacteria bacterium]|nr:sigma-54-dependent Fis family transcriptional regulator [Deltaproteobacteria bacterium]